MQPEIHFTLGPASWAPKILGSLLAGGVKACRINLSHLQAHELAGWFAHVRTAQQDGTGVDVRIGADLRGRKLRLGPLPGGGIQLAAGECFALHPVAEDAEAPGSLEGATVNCPSLGALLERDDLILLDDGAVRLRVDVLTPNKIVCQVEQGGALPERSGCSVPGKPLQLSCLTGKDEQDLDSLAHLGVDFLYLSFVERAEDIADLRQALARRRLCVPVVAKIERAVALDNIKDIAAAADAVCLARGDLGVEVPLAQVPYCQRRVAAASREAGTPLLLAGEVLLSTLDRPTPTRAEITDVVVALEQGCSGFVLSDETAMGNHPVQAVAWLQRVAETVLQERGGSGL